MDLVPSNYDSFKMQPKYFTHFRWIISVSLYLNFNFSSFLILSLMISKIDSNLSSLKQTHSLLSKTQSQTLEKYCPN